MIAINRPPSLNPTLPTIQLPPARPQPPHLQLPPDGLQLRTPFVLMSRPQKQAAVRDAFDRLEHANGVIQARNSQMMIGWDPSSDLAYQQALRERKGAIRDLKAYHEVEPDMVDLERLRRAPMGGMLERLNRWLAPNRTPEIMPYDPKRPWLM